MVCRPIMMRNFTGNRDSSLFLSLVLRATSLVLRSASLFLRSTALFKAVMGDLMSS